MRFRLEVGERRALAELAKVIDDALELADECGWRHALAYLIGERVPPQLIRRILTGEARARKTAVNTSIPFPEKSFGWKSRDLGDMQGLFAALRSCRGMPVRVARHVPTAVRGSVRRARSK